MTYEDSVSFYSMLNRLRTMEYAIKNSGWLMLDSVDALFKNAKERVYNEKNGEFACTNSLKNIYDYIHICNIYL